MMPFVMLSFLLLAVTPALTAALEPIRLPGVDLQRLQDLRKQRQSQNLDFTSDVLAPAVTSDVPSTQYLDIPIDHFGNSPGSFKNRYWFNDTFYAEGGPVVVMDIGESNAAPFVENGFLTEDDMRSGVMQLARKYKGIGVIWEHRYYGESVPFIDTKSGLTSANLTVDQYKYHTVEQALEDMVYFTGKFATKKVSNNVLKPVNTPWIVIGGSYPGVRAALLRARNPETIFASWASSAPVQAQVNMSSYWGAVERALPRNCSNDFVAMTTLVDDAFENGNQTFKTQLKRFLVQGRTSGALTLTDAQVQATPDVNIARIVMDPLNNWQRTGFTGAIGFCDQLQTFNGTRASTPEGVFANFDQLTAIQQFVVSIARHGSQNSITASPVITPAPFSIPNPPPNAPASSQLSPDLTSWTRQYCSEFGFYMGANPENKRSVQTRLFTMKDVQDDCDQIWGSSIPSSPAVQNVLKFGGGWNMNPSRVMFTNGEFDPWKTLSVASTEYNAPQRTASDTIPSADSAPSNGSYFGTIYSGQVHAIDMAAFDGDRPELIAAFDKGMDLFTRALDQWLPSFNVSDRSAIKDASESKTDSNSNKSKNAAFEPRLPASFVSCIVAATSLYTLFA